MKNELDCSIVKDLLPLYADNMLTNESKQGMENHLSKCKDCNNVYKNMSAEIKVEETSELDNIKKFLKRTKVMYSLYGLTAISAVTIIVCLIVDLAVNKKITWSFIATGSIVYCVSILLTVIVSRENKLLKTVSVISIGVVLLLVLIQVTRYYLMNTGSLWFFKYGILIVIIWLAVTWIPVLCRCCFKLNIYNCIAILLITIMVGNYLTKYVTGDYVGFSDVLNIENFMFNSLGNIIGAIILVTVGRVINSSVK